MEQPVALIAEAAAAPVHELGLDGAGGDLDGAAKEGVQRLEGDPGRVAGV